MSYSDEMKTEAKWAEIDLDALSYNMKNIREKVGADVQICAVVKANAYGHFCRGRDRDAEGGGRRLLCQAPLDVLAAL